MKNKNIGAPFTSKAETVQNKPVKSMPKKKKKTMKKPKKGMKMA